MRYLLLITLCYAGSCLAQTKNLMQYYFPVMELTTERTYKFVEKKDTGSYYYWKLQTEITATDTILKTTIYDKFGRMTHDMTEKITAINSKLLTYKLYEYAANGKQLFADTRVLEASVFNGRQKPDVSIKWSVSYKDFETKSMAKLSKTRTLVEVENGLAVFKDEMLLSIPDQNTEFKYKIECTYKKGEGLIAYTVSGGKGKTLHYILQQ